MPRLMLALGVVSALAGFSGRALAQSNAAGVMPGTVVGTTGAEKFKLIGREEPHVGSPVGKPINSPNGSALMRPYNPANPYESLQGTNLSASSVIAPVNGYTSNVPTSAVGNIVNAIKEIVGIETKPPMIQRVFTPGIYRRDHQRAQARMVVHD